VTEERSDHAADRRASAEQRSAELRDLGDRLRRGGRVTDADVDLAHRRAADAVERDLEAHARAATAHARAADRHREAADLADRAGQPERAAEHRTAAEADDEAAAEQRERAQPKPPE